jgi:ectoine hydroxylase-related dioxygenase (phytanoyl-CoA dioxygenase family)
MSAGFVLFCCDCLVCWQIRAQHRTIPEYVKSRQVIPHHVSTTTSSYSVPEHHMSHEKYPYPFHHNGWLVHIAIAIDPYDDQQGFVVVR